MISSVSLTKGFVKIKHYAIIVDILFIAPRTLFTLEQYESFEV